MLLLLATSLQTYLALMPIVFATILWALRGRFGSAESRDPITKGSKTLSGLKVLLEQRRQFFKHRYSSGTFQRHQELGRTFVTQFFGTKTVQTIDPANIRTITTSKFDDWGKSGWAAVSEYCLGDGILLNDGNSWRQSRTLLKPVFASFQPLHLSTILDRHTNVYFDSIRHLNGEVFSFHELASRLIFQVVGDIIWAESALWKSDQASRDRSQFLHHVSSLEGTSAMCFNLGIGALPELSTRLPSIYRSVTGMRTYFKRRIDRACTSASSDELVENCIARTLVGTHRSTSGLEGEIRNLFFASFDTTSALLSNLVHMISSQPEVQKKLRIDIAFLRGRPPSQADIAKCQYLRYTILESESLSLEFECVLMLAAMRLFTPVTYHCRQAKVDTVLPFGQGLNGQDPLPVSKGSNVIWSVYSLNRDYELWGHDSENFRPDRWQNVSSQEHFMPFGSGPRQCPGQLIAQYMVSYIVIRMMQTFDTLVHAGDQVFEEALAVSFFDRHGTPVSMQ